jgi:hypothetical protein
VMSERVQRRSGDRRDRARVREQNARERALRNRERGESMLARLHDDSAAAQAAVAEAAERLRLADVAVEGDKLGERTRASEPPQTGGG